MKIVHVSPTYAPVLGGAELHMKELSEGLAARGHDVTVLTANVRNLWDMIYGVHGKLPETEIINGVRVIRFDPKGNTPGSWLQRFMQLPGGWRGLKIAFGQDGLEMLAAQPLTLQLIPYLVCCQPDIVMAMNWFWSPAYHTYLAKRLKRFVFVGIPLFHTVESWCQRKVYGRMLASCSAVVANTEHEAKFMWAHGARRVEVAGVGVHAAPFACRKGAEIRGRYSIGDRPVVGFVGRQQANKGVIQLVEAMRTVWEWNPDVRLVVAGHRSDEYQDMKVESAIERLSPSERQRFIRIDQFEDKDKASLYDAFDVFVLPSTGESFGLAYLEAWLCQKPVIGARIGSTQCVIEENVDGLLVDPMDPKDIASKIIELLSDSAKRESMGMKGYSKTLARYTWDKVVDRVETLYRDLHAAKSATNARSAIYGDASRGSQV